MNTLARVRPALLVRLTTALTLGVLALLTAGSAGAQEQRLLVFGDSLSAAYGIAEEQGWVRLLEQRLAESDLPVEVINASVSGETTTGGRSRLPSLLKNYEPTHVMIELGGNDGLRGLPLNLMRENLIAMITMALDAGAEVILAGMQIPPNYGPRYTLPFFEQYGELAQEYDLALVPFLNDGVPQQPELMQADGVHPKAEGQPLILDNVWPVLLESLR